MKNSQEVDGSFLKKFTLVMLSGMVTFIVSSFKTGSSGEGKKSSTNLTLPIGSFVYFIFPFRYHFPPSPTSGTNNPDLRRLSRGSDLAFTLYWVSLISRCRISDGGGGPHRLDSLRG